MCQGGVYFIHAGHEVLVLGVRALLRAGLIVRNVSIVANESIPGKRQVATTRGLFVAGNCISFGA